MRWLIFYTRKNSLSIFVPSQKIANPKNRITYFNVHFIVVRFNIIWTTYEFAKFQTFSLFLFFFFFVKRKKICLQRQKRIPFNSYSDSNVVPMWISCCIFGLKDKFRSNFCWAHAAHVFREEAWTRDFLLSTWRSCLEETSLENVNLKVDDWNFLFFFFWMQQNQAFVFSSLSITSNSTTYHKFMSVWLANDCA